MKFSITLIAAVCLFASGCSTDAQVASKNLSKAADNFEIPRRIVFFDSFRGVLMNVEGKCSVKEGEKKVAITCKTGETDSGVSLVKKHFFGLSANVTWWSEQLEDAAVDVYHYRVILRPEALIPDVDLRTSGSKKG